MQVINEELKKMKWRPQSFKESGTNVGWIGEGVSLSYSLSFCFFALLTISLQLGCSVSIIKC